MRKRLPVLLGTVFCLMLTILGQQAPTPTPPTNPSDQDYVVRIVVNLVQVDAVVTDKAGRPVKDLKAEDFEILQDGHSQKITNFSYIETEPGAKPPAQPSIKGAPPAPPVRLRPEQVRRTMALVVDDLGLSFESMAYVREALKQFVEKRMQPGDLVAIIRTSAGMGALQQFTSDKRQLSAAIERVRYNFMGRSPISTFAPLRAPTTPEDTGDGEDRLEQFRTELFSVGTLGALNFVVRGLKDLPGRKSVVVLSDGFRIFGKDRDNTRVLDSLKRLTDMANRASVVIYTIDARGLPTLSLTAADDTSRLSSEQPGSRMQELSQEVFETQDGLHYLARETGGLFFHSSNDIGGEIGRVVDDQKGYYLIGYLPEDSTFREKAGERPYHKITVRVKRAGLTVRSRTGFFGMPDEQAQPGPRTPVEQLQTALTSPFASGGIHLRLTSLFGHSPKKGSLVRSVLHINGRDLSFTKDEEDWNKAVVDIMAVTFGDDGTAVDQTTKTYTIKVRGESYEQALKYGLIYNMNVPNGRATRHEASSDRRPVTARD